MYCKLKTVVSFLRVIVTPLSLRPFGNINQDIESKEHYSPKDYLRGVQNRTNAVCLRSTLQCKPLENFFQLTNEI